MPYNSAQKRLFRGIAHGSIPPKDGLTKQKAAELLMHDKKPKTATQTLRGK